MSKPFRAKTYLVIRSQATCLHLNTLIRLRANYCAICRPLLLHHRIYSLDTQVCREGLSTSSLSSFLEV
jgi:hypothetical protein